MARGRIAISGVVASSDGLTNKSMMNSCMESPEEKEEEEMLEYWSHNDNDVLAPTRNTTEHSNVHPSSHSQAQDLAEQASFTSRRSKRKRKNALQTLQDDYADSMSLAGVGAKVNDEEDAPMMMDESSDEEEDDDMDSIDDESLQDQQEESDFIEMLHENDVLSPHGNVDHVASSRLGNKRFEKLVADHQHEYHKARSNEARTLVARKVVNDYQRLYPPGRFVKRLHRGGYQKILQFSVLQKVTRALERMERKAPLLKEESDALVGRKRRCVSRLQDEYEETVFATPAKKRVTRHASAPMSVAKRTSPRIGSRDELSYAVTTRKRTPPYKVAKQVSPTPIKLKPTSRRASSRTSPVSVPSTNGQTFPRKQVLSPTSFRQKLPRITFKQELPPAAPKRKSPRFVSKPPATVSKRTSPRTLPNRVSPEAVPKQSEPKRNAAKSLNACQQAETPVVLGASSKPHGLGELAQRFTQWVLQLPDTDEIDLVSAVQHLKISKRRIYDIINILEGAGVLQRNAHATNTTFRWAAPLIHSSEQQESLEEEEELLDLWIEDLQDLHAPQAFISGRELAPLVDEDTSLLAVHLPQDNIIRTIHMPEQQEEAFAFKITTPVPVPTRRCARTNHPQAYLLDDNDEELRPIDFSPRDLPDLLPETPMRVPAYYPNGVARPPAHDQGRLNPLDVLLRALPMSLSEASDDDCKEEESELLNRREPVPFQVSDDEGGRTRSPFETLLQASTFCE